MKIINFIHSPSSYEQTTRWWALVLLFLFATMGSAVFYLHKNAQAVLYKKQKTYEELQIQAQKVSNLEQNLIQLREEKKHMQETIMHTQKKNCQTQFPVEFLEQITTILPNELYLKKIIIDQTITLEGKAKKKHQKKIQQFVACCLNQTWCPHAELEINPDSDDMLFFMITIKRGT